MKWLYTNISNNKGIKAVREAYDSYPNKTVATKVIITCLSLILTLNKFVFNFINYLQIIGWIIGTIVGTICVLAYANILWQNLKSNIYIPTSKINQYYTYDTSTIYSWYGQELSKNYLYFFENFNSKHKPIKFEHDISHSKISFLDILIYKDKNNTLQKTLYRKTADQQSYLHARSVHPKLLKRSMPYSQALRITKYKKHCAILKQNFIEKGYKENILKDKIDKVDNIDRKNVLSKKKY